MVSDQRQDGFLTPGEIAETLKVSTETVRRLILAGDLPAIDVTPTKRKCCYRVRRDHFEQFLAGRWVRRVERKGKEAERQRRSSLETTKNHLGI